MKQTAAINTRTDPARQAWILLRLGFIAAPILAGLDKFANLMVDWSQYLAPFVADIVPSGLFMGVVGVVEVAAGVGVAVKPRLFAYVVAAWLGLIIINLLIVGGYLDVALRDLGLLLGALALGRLSEKYATD